MREAARSAVVEAARRRDALVEQAAAIMDVPARGANLGDALRFFFKGPEQQQQQQQQQQEVGVEEVGGGQSAQATGAGEESERLQEEILSEIKTDQFFEYSLAGQRSDPSFLPPPLLLLPSSFSPSCLSSLPCFLPSLPTSLLLPPSTSATSSPLPPASPLLLAPSIH
eukprot:709963-Hanusia_phi.AAC.1